MREAWGSQKFTEFRVCLLKVLHRPLASISPGSLLEMLTLESHTRLLNYSFFLLFTCCFLVFFIALSSILLIISSVISKLLLRSFSEFFFLFFTLQLQNFYFVVLSFFFEKKKNKKDFYLFIDVLYLMNNFHFISLKVISF